MTYTEASVLAHHGITGASLPDEARAAGLIYACLGCGSVGGINPEDGERARQATRDALDPDLWCCEDADQIIY